VSELPVVEPTRKLPDEGLERRHSVLLVGAELALRDEIGLA
jgi:hypothetical protein